MEIKSLLTSIFFTIMMIGIGVSQIFIDGETAQFILSLGLIISTFISIYFIKKNVEFTSDRINIFSKEKQKINLKKDNSDFHKLVTKIRVVKLLVYLFLLMAFISIFMAFIAADFQHGVSDEIYFSMLATISVICLILFFIVLHQRSKIKGQTFNNIHFQNLYLFDKKLAGKYFDNDMFIDEKIVKDIKSYKFKILILISLYMVLPLIVIGLYFSPALSIAFAASISIYILFNVFAISTMPFTSA